MESGKLDSNTNSALAEEDGQFAGCVAEMREEAGLHLERGDAGGTAAEVDGCHCASIRGEHRYGERAETDLILLIAESVAVTAHVAQQHAQLFERGNGAGG